MGGSYSFYRTRKAEIDRGACNALCWNNRDYEACRADDMKKNEQCGLGSRKGDDLLGLRPGCIRATRPSCHVSHKQLVDTVP